MSKTNELLRQMMDDPSVELLRPVRKTVLLPQPDGSIVRQFTDKAGNVTEDAISATAPLPWADEHDGRFLRESKYIDFSAPIVIEKAHTLFCNIFDDIQKTRIAYEFVRDNIQHSFDINAKIITTKASDVLLHSTGICHAKANLLAALLRSQAIPSGFCFQRVTRLGDDSKGYCVHCYNAIWLDGHWIKLDARGNTNGKNAQFSLGEPILAFPCRPQYQEYFLPGIYAEPHAETMSVLERATSLQDVLENLPDAVSEPPDVP